MAPPLRAIRWRPSWRIIASRFPPVGLFDAIADPADFDALFELEAMTNPRLRDELGQIQLIAPNHRIAGPGTTPIMAAFCHPNPEGSRFSPGHFGVYYAAHDRQTAIAETVHHRSRMLAATAEAPCTLEMRCYLADISCKLHDIRAGWPELHDPVSYVASQRMAVELRDAGSNGIVYDSVRQRGGHCVAMFQPDRIAPSRQGEHLYYQWDGHRIAHVVIANEVIAL